MLHQLDNTDPSSRLSDAGFLVPGAFAMDTNAPTSTLTTIEISLPPFIIPGTSPVSAPEGGISTVHITLPTTVPTTVSGPGGISAVHITLPTTVATTISGPGGISTVHISLPGPVTTTTVSTPEGGISTVHFTIHPTGEVPTTFNTAVHPIPPAETVARSSNDTESVIPLHSIKTTGGVTLANSTQAPSASAHPNRASLAKGIHNHSVLILAVGLAYIM
ncbi:hypothetical protein N7474_009639 [Penicillium riverlandense]|uniref:uncharacterized protein n=1 Tax=Penicillium riverlandense TaxID=1903569 RepID=UPI002546C864|nr:uncharacterized protein N7474_009639 [Penicillium riverlandense]KAJ5808370.1 hypothetical protein N7474_009639 [Penicillium riverlandense]